MNRPALVGYTLISALVLVGCSEVDLGTAPFLCNNGNPACPEGYVCKYLNDQKMCVKEGSSGPKKDAQSIDAGTSSGDANVDAALSDSTIAGAEASLPPNSELIISELMISPSDVADDGEWFELYNPGSSAININGWIIKDATGTHTINSGTALNIAAKGYLVLGKNKTAFNVAYEYGTDIALNQTGDSLTIMHGSTTVDSISWTAPPWTITSGSSLSLKASLFSSDHATRNQNTSWCTESTVFSGVDKGSPGVAPKCQ